MQNLGTEQTKTNDGNYGIQSTNVVAEAIHLNKAVMGKMSNRKQKKEKTAKVSLFCTTVGMQKISSKIFHWVNRNEEKEEQTGRGLKRQKSRKTWGIRKGSILQVGSLAVVLKAVKKPGCERIRNYQDD